MFWLSYECFSILHNAFLLKSAISSHNSCGLEMIIFSVDFTILFILGYLGEIQGG